MRTKLLVCGLFLLLQLGCKVQEVNLNNELGLLNDSQLNEKNSELILFNLRNESELLGEVEDFRNKNDNAELEDVVILEFLELQICTNEQGRQFKDYPNELQSVFDLYSSMNEKEMEWLNNAELTVLKYTSVRLIVNNAKDEEATEHIREQLGLCMKDRDYAELVISSSELNECSEKRR